MQGRLGQLKAGVEQKGWRFVPFVRLVPLFPFNLLNYGLGLTRINLRSYLAVSFVTLAPGRGFTLTWGWWAKKALTSENQWVELAPRGLLALSALAVGLPATAVPEVAQPKGV
ncbi:MAG: hypothetical protein A2600_09670 [Candidatus Lambdaproteobacteria bacterium RIFOXYD1_FULL_56_27]|uniref:TVP38/TMEM64 family membrane protein n=1 Tax=Candidatus Lambdaproteobacteria bacterium RIFOXYD2_FULL_56_26 TaxID=1817773 RepID=A0A1F6GV02_9PROT|nr:MAG: hypothetical protein A2557_04940 [Candidatus Lambdaproteobacteria bacterium RIFOXYD2_FULL_56_26]OGH02312.1 MAG: hypothetical protein A2426_03420 [Candidatus Lambdaproteobacteria bacterium RIFOXYC1_FULL_56_13]OGH10082.1 MAG: hypothetical protein A2600_09670 [Candidatus Lambdaproteobacteria bacterium RIFOXYD1_FULL_56_27]